MATIIGDSAAALAVNDSAMGSVIPHWAHGAGYLNTIVGQAAGIIIIPASGTHR